ncbi:hypothetical protein [Microbacterium gorillae]|uniref:hypothetical protein n=1 Tax=Microbacterium gorillae TaxID=1231063 RepID=UPI00058D7485|nr:hypothetical protein [Microbacterium gorillae]
MRLPVLPIALVVGAVSLLAGCATPTALAAAPEPTVTASAMQAAAAPTASAEEPTTSEAITNVLAADEPAQQQVDTWLATAPAPPGAVRLEAAPAVAFGSYTGWPCQPTASAVAFWSLSGVDMRETVTWLQEHTPDGLVTWGGLPPENGVEYSAASVTYSPGRDSMDGIVYTVLPHDDGVLLRAEIGAVPDWADCTAPEGSVWGPPGMG